MNLHCVSSGVIHSFEKLETRGHICMFVFRFKKMYLAVKMWSASCQVSAFVHSTLVGPWATLTCCVGKPLLMRFQIGFNQRHFIQFIVFSPKFSFHSIEVYHQWGMHVAINTAVRAGSAHNWVEPVSSWHDVRWLTLWWLKSQWIVSINPLPKQEGYVMSLTSFIFSLLFFNFFILYYFVCILFYMTAWNFIMPFPMFFSQPFICEQKRGTNCCPFS